MKRRFASVFFVLFLVLLLFPVGARAVYNFGTDTYAQNESKRLTKIVEEATNGHIDIYTFTYDEQGRLAKVSSEDSDEDTDTWYLEYVYDSEDRLIKILNSIWGDSGPMYEYFYDENGFLIRRGGLGEGGGASLSIEYDSQGRPIRVLGGDEWVKEELELRYYDNNTRIEGVLTRTTCEGNVTKKNVTYIHVYDEEGRLVSDGTVTYHYDYRPFVAESQNDEPPQYFRIKDKMGRNIWSLYAPAPESIHTDDDGYVTEIVCAKTKYHNGSTIRFYYETVGSYTPDYEPDYANGKCGTYANWTLSADGVLTISGYGDLYGDLYRGNCPDWVSYAHMITEVNIDDGITFLPKQAFYDCEKLQTLIIPPSVNAIGSAAFAGCTSLTSITLPDKIVSIHDETFENCTSLTDVTLPSKLQTIGDRAFEDCSSLEHIDLPDSVTSISMCAFSKCSKLREISLSDNLQEIGYAAFQYCTSLEEIILPQSLQTLIPAFMYCSKLEKINIPAGLDDIQSDTFEGCSSLNEIYFCGNAPYFGTFCFKDITATCYYPARNKTWTIAKMDDHGGNLTWVPYCVEHVLDNDWTLVEAPTCTEWGLETNKCLYCDYTEEMRLVPKGHTWENNICTDCGTVLELSRLAGNTRFETSFAVANQLRNVLGVEKFDTVLITSGTNFADALSGSYLASMKNAPILLGCNNDFNPKYVEQFNTMLVDYVKANLVENGTVYILGGEKAVLSTVDEALAEYNVVRLAGSNRYETNILILEEAGVDGKEVLVCNGEGFADSLSASATELPILLVNSKYGIFDLQKPFLESCGGNFRIIGGYSAVSEEVQKELETYGSSKRIAGVNRFETSVLIAKEYFAAPETAVLAYGWNFPDGLCGGPLAASMNAPLILTMEGYASWANEEIRGKNIYNGIVLGSSELVSDQTVHDIYHYDPSVPFPRN